MADPIEAWAVMSPEGKLFGPVEHIEAAAEGAAIIYDKIALAQGRSYGHRAVRVRIEVVDG